MNISVCNLLSVPLPRCRSTGVYLSAAICGYSQNDDDNNQNKC